MPIFWDAGDLVVHRLTRRPSSGFSTINLDPALIGTQKARNQISQRRLPVARHSCQTDNLTRAQVQRQIRQASGGPLGPRRHVRKPHQNRASGSGFCFWQGNRAADHHRRQSSSVRRVGLDLPDHLSMTQHNAAVGNRHDLMQLVADEDNRQTQGDRLAQRVKQRIRFLRGQNGGWLVEDQNAGLTIERLEDFDPLPFTHRKAAHPRIGVDGKSKLGRKCGDPCPRHSAPLAA